MPLLVGDATTNDDSSIGACMLLLLLLPLLLLLLLLVCGVLLPLLSAVGVHTGCGVIDIDGDISIRMIESDGDFKLVTPGVNLASPLMPKPM